MAGNPFSPIKWDQVQDPNMTFAKVDKELSWPDKFLQKIYRLFSRTVVHTTFDKEGQSYEAEMNKDTFIEWGKRAWRNLGGRREAFTSDKDWLFCAHVLAHLKEHSQSYRNVSLEAIRSLVQNRNDPKALEYNRLQRCSIEKLRKEMCKKYTMSENDFDRELQRWRHHSPQCFHDSQQGLYFLGSSQELSSLERVFIDAGTWSMLTREPSILPDQYGFFAALGIESLTDPTLSRETKEERKRILYGALSLLDSDELRQLKKDLDIQLRNKPTCQPFLSRLEVLLASQERTRNLGPEYPLSAKARDLFDRINVTIEDINDWQSVSKKYMRNFVDCSSAEQHGILRELFQRISPRGIPDYTQNGALRFMVSIYPALSKQDQNYVLQNLKGFIALNDPYERRAFEEAIYHL